ncbi:Gfo/Idh/MocA family protein [Paenibacillus lentus]|uniref:Gfo/Idh/MocA family oxidoreductase n=1 Tax=Paenibacillus lentus TaxID=1338368 RepID=A0A3Q8SA03_9BACL|nr:Gfo/Idh/MocA family oxidoreductase [Paenibacillus lentus]AZK45805.1 gfo/Idh/MocA family oxidoreductase [Paenibacillus lentus]
MTLKVGIVGTGWFSKVHGDILAEAEGVRIAATCGTSMEKANSLASRYSGARGFDRLTDMLDSEQLDAVYLCIPPMAHEGMETELIARGIPFLVEKPLGVDLDGPNKILEQLRRNPVITSVGYHFRYKQSALQLKELLKGQKIGMALGTWMGSMPGVGWWRKQEGSGGQFIEQTTHLVDLLRYVAGEVEEVYAAYANRIVHEQHEGVTVSDVGTVTLKLSSGAIANLSNTCVLPDAVGEVGLSFYTEQGILAWDPDQLEIKNNGVSTSYSSTDNPYVAETAAFLHAVRTGDASGIRSDYADAVRTQAVTCAALESSITGQAVRVF